MVKEEYDGTLEENVHNRDWDFLIVLDSCRYDYFNRFYREVPFLPLGDVEALRSPGLSSAETLIEVFGGEYDWDVYSARPKINDIDNGIKESDTRENIGDYDAGHHFHNVYNYWMHGLPGQYVGTSRFTDYVVDDIKYTGIDRKSIAWYMDPHAEYEGSVKLDFRSLREPMWSKLTDGNGDILDGVKQMYRMAYTSNIIHALYSVVRVAGHLDCDIAITSDHGEHMLHGGDDQTWLGHQTKHDTKHLRQVPWMEFNTSKVPNIDDITEREYVMECYRRILGRVESGTNVDEYIKRIKHGPLTREVLIEKMMQSKGYRDDIGDPTSITCWRKNDSVRRQR